MALSGNPYATASVLAGRYVREALLAGQGIDLNEAIEVVRNYRESWPGRRAGQLWCRGRTRDGRAIKVLMGPVFAGTAEMIAVYAV